MIADKPAPVTITTRLVALSLAALALGCFKSGPTDSTEPDFSAPAPAAEEEDDEPPVFSEFGDGVLRGLVRLDRGVQPPEGSKIEIRVMAGKSEGSKIVQQHDVPITGPGPWAFEFTVDTSGFDPSTSVGLGVMLTVPPDGAAWWASPKAIPVFQVGQDQQSLDIVISPVDSRADG